MVTANKENAVSFLRLIVSGEVREAYRNYASPAFIHHNPYFRGDVESLMLAMAENAAAYPDKRLEIKHAIEEGNMVAVHSHIQLEQGDIGRAIVHIFRFENERIAELWDVGQPIPAESPNENGAF
ncbi:ester cyclase [Paenibacillus aurantiacus]|uniref:Ester cyclase n=1 Tax=Paenibacillus aurantiacus TaxID=1936118 RepID=A0ABV5KSU9_9BACL